MRNNPKMPSDDALLKFKAYLKIAEDIEPKQVELVYFNKKDNPKVEYPWSRQTIAAFAYTHFPDCDLIGVL